MLLKPEKMGFFQLFQVLFGRDLQEKDFVHCLEFIVEPRFKPKWLVFLSLLIQKLLHSMANKLKCIGDIFESFLNPEASSNCNVFMLVFNCIQGKQLVDKDSANYVSMIGHLDERVELLDNNSIKREEPNKYNTALSMMASKVSYENKSFVRAIVVDRWKMVLVECRDYWNDYQEKATTQGFIMLDKSEDHDTYVVAFRGTEPFDANAWSTDIDISWFELLDVGRTHAGFMKALGLQLDLKNDVVGWPKEIENDENRPRAYYSIRDLLKKHLKLNGNDKAKFILTGHSLGGALAILFPAILMLHEETFLLERLEGVYTFGQPRVGDTTFANYMEKNLKKYGIKYFRFVYGNDIVPRLPFSDDIMKFDHFGTCLYYDRSYKGKKMQDEPNKNYFSWKEIIPMQVNAFWELVRSFTIVRKYGPEYQEGWLLKGVRLLGLVFPGMPAHCPQDYVNVTRLGLPLHLD
ncbi:Lipase protein [Spatholobus suberectus]|nr:Lipase protein [Spatholobus suberectus]